MKVLVTGASGFVGGNFARYAIARGFQVFAHYHTRKPQFSINEEVVLLRADLRASPPDWPQVDLVIHAATNANARDVPAHDLIEGNVVATKNLVCWMKKKNVRKAVFCSTVSAYGDVQVARIDEGTSHIDTGVYGLTKLLSESLFQESGDVIDCLAVRLPGVLGPNAHGSWLTNVVKSIDAGEEIAIFNPDSPFNNCAHVADIFAMICRYLDAAAAGYDMVNVSAGSQMSVVEVIGLIHRELAAEPAIRVIGSAKTSFTISSEKAQRLYGYAPMRLEDMLVRYLREVQLASPAKVALS